MLASKPSYRNSITNAWRRPWRPGVVRWSDVATFDARPTAIGCRLLLLDGTDATVQERSVRVRMHTQFIQGYAMRFLGRTEIDLIRHSCGERDTFRKLLASSKMAKLQLPAEASAESTADAGFRFWTAGAAR
jgi:hypothetical protein